MSHLLNYVINKTFTYIKNELHCQFDAFILLKTIGPEIVSAAIQIFVRKLFAGPYVLRVK